LFTQLTVTLKVWLTGLTFASAVADEIAGWLVRFVHPAFAWFKVAAFLTLEFSLAAMLILVSASLVWQRLEQRSRVKATDIPLATGDAGSD